MKKLILLLVVLSSCEIIAPTPTALFATDLLPFATVKVSNHSTNAEEVEINWGDGHIATYFSAAAVTHTYAKNGEYSIVMTAYADRGKKLATVLNKVVVDNAMGNVMVYFRANFVAPVEVNAIKTDGSKSYPIGTMTTFFEIGTPTCGTQGTNKELPEGNYNIYASRGGKTVQAGTLAVTNKSCGTVLLQPF